MDKIGLFQEAVRSYTEAIQLMPDSAREILNEDTAYDCHQGLKQALNNLGSADVQTGHERKCSDCRSHRERRHSHMSTNIACDNDLNGIAHAN
jgi:hypothetical protein